MIRFTRLPLPTNKRRPAECFSRSGSFFPPVLLPLLILIITAGVPGFAADFAAPVDLENFDSRRMSPGDRLILSGEHTGRLEVETPGVTITADGPVHWNGMCAIDAPDVTFDGVSRDDFIIEVPAGTKGYIVSTTENGTDAVIANMTIRGHYGPEDIWGTSLSLFGRNAVVYGVRFIGAPHQDQVKVNAPGEFDFQYCEFLDHKVIGDVHADCIQARAPGFSLRMYRCYFAPADRRVQNTMISTGVKAGAPINQLVFVENIFATPAHFSIHLKNTEISTVGDFVIVDNVFRGQRGVDNAGFNYRFAGNRTLKEVDPKPEPWPLPEKFEIETISVPELTGGREPAPPLDEIEGADAQEPGEETDDVLLSGGNWSVQSKGDGSFLVELNL